MKPWWKVAVPNEDIRKGRLDPSVFAIDLGDVTMGGAPPEYRDPARFFTRTYMTNGLRELLVKVLVTLYKNETKSDVQRMAPVVQLVTPFGGGKTHSLLALYHLTRHYEKIRSLDPIREIVKEAGLKAVPETNVACIDGTHLDPLVGDKKKEGVRVRTLWGEIAYQLGGAKLYEMVREHDEKLVSPGKKRLREVLEKASPCLLILDETLEYVVRAQGVEDKEGKNLRGQTMAFMQELTGVVASLAEDDEHSAVLVVTLPSSHTERYDDRAENDFRTLSHITRRLELRHSPVEGMEIYEIVRRRLFDEIKDADAPGQVARELHHVLEKLCNSVPKDFRDERYREKIERAYPFHPELIDILYEKWGALVQFQRTRGVLRFLALVVCDLYKKNDPNSLIMPGSVDLSNRMIKDELLAYLDEGYPAVVDSDIAGPGSKCASIDRELPSEFERFNVATRVATLIFLHSVRTNGSPQVSTQRIRAATVMPDLGSPVVSEALERMGSLWYLYPDEKRENWLFRKEPGIGKIIHEKMDALSEQEVFDFIHQQMALVTGDGSVFIAPEDPAKIPDSEALKFVFLSPAHPYGKEEKEDAEKFCAKLLNEYLPTSPRRRKNTLVFVLPSSEKVGKILALGRELMALQEVDASAEIKDTLSESQKRDLGSKLKDIQARFANELQIAYGQVLVPSQDGFAHYSLGLNVLRGRGNTKEYVERFLKDNEILVDDIEPSILVSRAWPTRANYVSTADAYEAFLKYTGVELISGKGVIRRAVAKGVSTGVFGYGISEYPEKMETVRFEEALSEGDVELSEKAWLVKPEIAAKMKPSAAEEAKPGEPPPRKREKGKAKEEAEEAEQPRRRHVIISVEAPDGRLAEITRGVIKPLKDEGAEVTVEVKVDATGEITDQTLKMKVEETLKQLGAKYRLSEE
jgi:hypothetical protein